MIVDRFGSDIYIVKESDTSFIINVRVILSPQFYAWLFGLGTKVKILSPKRVADDYRDRIQDINSLY